jgi:hypothetical protein
MRQSAIQVMGHPFAWEIFGHKSKPLSSKIMAHFMATPSGQRQNKKSAL